MGTTKVLTSAEGDAIITCQNKVTYWIHYRLVHGEHESFVEGDCWGFLCLQPSISCIPAFLPLLLHNICPSGGYFHPPYSFHKCLRFSSLGRLTLSSLFHLLFCPLLHSTLQFYTHPVVVSISSAPHSPSLSSSASSED